MMFVTVRYSVCMPLIVWHKKWLCKNHKNESTKGNYYANNNNNNKLAKC